MATDPGARIRREPPAFRNATVSALEAVGPRLSRVQLVGSALVGFSVPEPAASVRLLLPSSGASDLEIPVWNGNEFLLADGRRPVIRTFTPLDADPDHGALTVEIVRHGHGAAATWVERAPLGAPVAVSGPGRGYIVEPGVAGYVLGGDETALPAIGQLLESIPHDVPVRVHVEVAAPEGRVELPPHPRAEVTFHDLRDETDPGSELVTAMRATSIADDERVWIAGEAAAVQRIRRHLFEERGLPRRQATVRGYWKRGRAGSDDRGE